MLEETLQPTQEVQVTTSLNNDFFKNALERAGALDKAEVGMTAKPEYFDFAKVGDKQRGIFMGFMDITVKDAKSDSGYATLPAVLWLNSNKELKMNAGNSLVKDFQQLGVKEGTAVEIEFTGKEDTKSGNKVNVFKITYLNA